MIASILRLQRQDIKRLGNDVDVYGIHKLVYNLFPGEKRNFLFLDKAGRYDERTILIISLEKPIESNLGLLQSKVIPEHFLDHPNYAFEVRMNPVTRRSDNRKTIPITGEDSLKSWFIKKQDSWGIEILTDKLEVFDTGLQKFNKGENTIYHNKATFRGILTVKNKDLFRTSFENGLGRGKAFGFGLLQLVPIKMKKENEK